jgi:hypothetical protein
MLFRGSESGASRAIMGQLSDFQKECHVTQLTVDTKLRHIREVMIVGVGSLEGVAVKFTMEFTYGSGE